MTEFFPVHTAVLARRKLPDIIHLLCEHRHGSSQNEQQSKYILLHNILLKGLF
jgi:hypothetical protein